MLLPLRFSDRLDNFAFALLAVEHVPVLADFTSKQTLIFLTQIFVLSLKIDKDGADHGLVFLIGHLSSLLTHLAQMHIKTITNVAAAFTWRLDTEL